MSVLAHLSKERVCWLGLAAALVLATGLRLRALGDEDYWVDELYALLNSAGTKDEFRALPHGVIIAEVPRLTEIAPGTTVLDVWRSMEGDNHPPLYFVLSHLWRRSVGDGEFAVRLLPVLLSVLSIVPVFMMLRAYDRPGPAVWASLLLAITYGHIYVGQQNRQYALTLLLVGCSFWFWARLECGWPRLDRWGRLLWAVLYGGSMVAALLTHYFAALPLIGQAIYVLLRVRGRLRWCWLGAVACAAAAFVLIWGHHLPGQRTQIAAQDWLIENDPGHTWHSLVRLANLPVRLLAQCPGSNTNQGYAVIGILLAAGMVVLLRRRLGREGWLFASWYLLPVAFLAVTDLAASRGMMGHLRFAAVGIGGLVGLLALAVDALSRTWRVAALAVLVVVALGSLSYPTRRNPQAGEAGALLARQVGPGDLVIYDGVGHPPYWSGRLMLLTTHYAPTGRYPAILLHDPPTAEVLAEMSGYRRLLVVSGWTDSPVCPVPATHHLAAASDPLWGIGPIRVYERRPD